MVTLDIRCVLLLRQHSKRFVKSVLYTHKYCVLQSVSFNLGQCVVVLQ